MSILKIPSDTEDLTVFIQRLASLIRVQSTHLYIDTSFLMWMTKIGSDSRRELIDWLQKNCAGRVHVPIWAAHEYLKHHVAETIKKDLTKKTKKVDSLVNRAYTDLRPFIDEPLGNGAENPSAIRIETRMTLRALGRLVSKIKRWHKSYQKHASEVISFINEVTPEQTSVYDHLENITQTGAGRFIGSIPPGYKDQWKKRRGQQSQESKNEAPAGSNQYGDLVFWKEVLVHAKHMRAEALIVVTNDRKNDWYMGRNDKANIDSTLLSPKKSRKPVPSPHPMLVMEARLVGGVSRVELLDSVYLAVLLRKMSEGEVRAFADVAIIPDLESEDERDRRARLREEQIPEDTARVNAVADEPIGLSLDLPQVQYSPAQFSRALYASRSTTDERESALLEEWHTSVGEERSLTETITSQALDGFDHKKLARLARELHDRVLQRTPGYEQVLADLVSILSRLPSNIAAALYLGLLASMYLVRETNAPRFPPSSPVAQALFDRQSAAYALSGVRAVAKRLSDNEAAPLYLPDSACPKIAITLDTEPNASMTNQLRSLRAGEVELLTPAQQDGALRLGALFDGTRPTDGEAIIRKACDLFAIPIGQVEHENLFEQGYSLTKTIGFKRPEDIRIPKELPNGE